MPASRVIDGVLYGTPSYGAPDYNKNVGGLVMVSLGDLQFIAENAKLYLLNISKHAVTDLTDEELPSFCHRLPITVLNEQHSINGLTCYALCNEDIRPIAKYMSELGYSAHVSAAARILGRWVDGELVGTVKPLSYFYSDVSAEDEEMHRF